MLALAALAVGAVTWAASSGTSSQGRNYVSGGVSAEELVALHERREAFSLWLVTAAKRSGAHLADVQLRIVDAERRTVFDAKLDGPWLFIDLAPGRYNIEAQFAGQTRRAMTTIHAGDHHQAFFYFDVADEVGPDQPAIFPRNPYGR
jgi:hypothetical protein